MSTLFASMWYYPLHEDVVVPEIKMKKGFSINEIEV
jgi:hypothetical protein